MFVFIKNMRVIGLFTGLVTLFGTVSRKVTGLKSD